MATLETIKQCWALNKEQSFQPLDEAMINRVIRSGLREEQTNVWEYFWAAAFFQLLIYSYLTHLVIRYWGDWFTMAISLGGILLYIPFTVVFLHKFRNMRLLKFGKPELASQDIYTMLKTQRAVLSGFYKFKKWFDLVSIPANGVVIVMILARYALIPSIKYHLTGALIAFLIAVTTFVIATFIENKKRFIQPMQKLEMVIREIEADNNTQ